MDRQPPNPNEIIDMELNCEACGSRLFLPLAKALEVQNTVEKGGQALLVCICGAGNVIWKRRKTND